MSATPASAAIPEHVGKYEVLGIAGRGAMGVVYVGRDPVIDRMVAIKVCTLPDDGDPGEARMARRMFLNEARLAGHLDHPNVLRVYDAGEMDASPYIIMEFVEGARTLQPHCKPDRLMPAGEVLGYVRQCAAGLDYAHARGVVHRDIKPANIMLTADDAVKIVDFGIAQRQQADRTQLVGTFGSPRYMSPEQASDEPVAAASDIYSLAASLFELLTGRPVFSAPSLVSLLRAIVEDEPPRLAELRPDLPASLDRVVARALSKDPARRHASAAEFADDIGRVIADLSRPRDDTPDEETQLALLSAMRFLTGFPEANLRELMKTGRWERHETGTTIVVEGAAARDLYLLAEGEVTVRKGNVTIARIAAGECFGEMGFLTRAERSASVVAGTPVLVLKISQEVSQWASLACQTRFTKAFQRTLVERLADAGNRLARPGA